MVIVMAIIGVVLVVFFFSINAILWYCGRSNSDIFASIALLHRQNSIEVYGSVKSARCRLTLSCGLTITPSVPTSAPTLLIR